MSEYLSPNIVDSLKKEGSLLPTVVVAHDISDAWFQCLKAALENGHEYYIDRGSFGGTKTRRKELDLALVEIRHPQIRPLTPFVPEGITPPTSEETIENYLKYLMTSEKAPNEQYTYGEYVEKQIFEVIRMFKEDGLNTNQAYITIGDAESIWQKDPPCLRGIDCRARYGKLHFVTYWRSWDLWAGFPTNLGGLQRMKEFMAGEIGLEDGTLIAASKGLHLYEHTWDLAKAVTKMDQTEKTFDIKP